MLHCFFKDEFTTGFWELLAFLYIYLLTNCSCFLQKSIISTFHIFKQARWLAAVRPPASKRMLPWVTWIRLSPRMARTSRWRSGRKRCRPWSAGCPSFQQTTTWVKRKQKDKPDAHWFSSQQSWQCRPLLFNFRNVGPKWNVKICIWKMFQVNEKL